MGNQSCPDDATLHQLLSDQVGFTQREPLTRHLDDCVECQSRLERLPLGGMRVPVEVSNRTPSPTLRAVMASAVGRSFDSASSSASPSGDEWNSLLGETDDPSLLGVIGSYEITHRVGQGGMGVVFAGRDPTLGRIVAIKMLHPALAASDHARQRFLREARAAAMIQSPHVVTIHTADVFRGVPYLVMELVRGRSLQQILDRSGRLPAAEVARIGLQAALGLAAAHRQGLVHRDIKPANLLLEDETRCVKITDFGLVRATGKSDLTEPGIAPGTPHFMAPEQARGDAVDHRTDLFALGCVLYVAVTGQLPFPGDSVLSVLRQVCDREPTPVDQLHADVPGYLAETIRRLMQKDSSKRFPSADDAAAALKLGDVPSSAVGRPRKLRRVVWWTAVGGSLAAACASTLFVLHGSKQARQTPGGSRSDYAVVAQGFSIRASGQRYGSLVDAIYAARAGDVIEIHTDGPHATGPIHWADKPLTIRAASGARPTIVLFSQNTDQSSPLLDTNASLTLEGIELHWTGPPIERGEPGIDHCAISVHDARLRAVRCRIFANQGNACIGLDRSSCQLDDCLLLAAQGLGVFWTPGGDGRVQLDGNIISARKGLIIDWRAGDAGADSKLRLASNTIRAHTTLQFLLHRAGRLRPSMSRATEIVVTHNVFDTEHLLVLTNMARRSLSLQDSHRGREILDILPSLVKFTDRENLYADRASFVSMSAGSQPPIALPTAPTTVDGWVAFWDQSDSSSGQGKIVFRGSADSREADDHRLLDVQLHHGVLPAQVGAQLARAGE